MLKAEHEECGLPDSFFFASCYASMFYGLLVAFILDE